MAGEPSLQELVREALDSRLLDVHTALPGIVQEYDRATQTATIRLAVLRALESADGSTAHEEIPLLPNVPIGWFASGGFSMQFPVTSGDTVWVMFSEAAWAAFRSTGQVEEPGDLSRFGLSYPVAIPVARPVARALPALASDDEASIEVPDGKTLRVGGPTAGLVALADKVNEELGKIAEAFSSFVPGSGGASFPDAYTSAGDVSATKLLAE